MLERALEQKGPVSLTLKDHGKENLLFTVQELILLSQAVIALQSFAQAGKFSYLEDNISLSYIQSMLNSLKNKYCLIKKYDFHSIKLFKDVIIAWLVV